MSLTRDQWVEMLEEVRAIERTVKFAEELPRGKRSVILTKTERIKEKIQSVIGQME